MPEVKKPGDRCRTLRDGAPEEGWTLVRFEPASGNAVLEREGVRINVPRAEFDRLNFPGSDAVLSALRSEEDTDGIAAFASGDLGAVRSALLTAARAADHAFRGIQTTGDLMAAIETRAHGITRSIEILKLDVGRAEREYNRFVARTALEYDKKDSLLTRSRNLEDQLAAREHEENDLLPRWRALLEALVALDARLGNA